eukprot:1769-Pelagococcus_subviridis.AAC.1
MGGEMRREKSLRNGVHHTDAVVWGPVYRTRLGLRDERPPVAQNFQSGVRALRDERRRDRALLDPGEVNLRLEPRADGGVERDAAVRVQLVAAVKRAREPGAQRQTHQSLLVLNVRLRAARAVRRRGPGLDRGVAEVVEEQAVRRERRLCGVVRVFSHPRDVILRDVPNVDGGKFRVVRRDEREPRAVRGPRVLARGARAETAHHVPRARDTGAVAGRRRRRGLVRVGA